MNTNKDAMKENTIDAMKENTIYIATKRHPGCICFLDPDGNEKKFIVASNNRQRHITTRGLRLCDYTDHNRNERALNALEGAIDVYRKSHNALPKHIEFSWYGMVSRAPRADDIQTARTELELTSIPFSGILNTTSHILLKVGFFAATVVSIAAWAYQSCQENTPR